MLSRFLLFCVVAPAFAQTTLNVSQDLVRMGIASNMVPNSPNLDSAPLLNAAINYAKSRQVSRIIADPGAYYLLSLQYPAESRFAYIGIVGTNNLTIDFQGSDIYLSKQQGLAGFFAIGNTNLTLQNFTMDCVQQPFTQLRVVSVDGVQGQIQFTVQPGYQDPAVLNTAASGGARVFTDIFRNGQPASGLNGIGRLVAIPPFGGDRLTLRLGPSGGLPITPSVFNQIRPGDTAVVSAISGYTIMELNCKSCTLRNIRIYAGGNNQAISWNAESSLMERVYVMPRPGTDRLMNASADAIDSRNGGQSNIVRLNRAIRTFDDGIAIWTYIYGSISSVTNSRTAVLEASPGGSLFVLDFFSQLPGLKADFDLNYTPVVGSTLVFERAVDRVVLGSAVITSIGTPVRSGSGPSHFSVTFDRDLPSNLSGSIVYGGDAHNRGGNTLIERNSVQNKGPTGGFGVAMFNSTVQGNYIRNTSMSGMRMESTLDPTTVGISDMFPPSSNVVIKNNVVDGVNQVRDQNVGVTLGGIQVRALADNFAIPQAGVHQQVTIAGNFIADPGYSAVWMGNAVDSTVSGNYFLHPNNQYTTPASTNGINVADLKIPLAVEHSTNVTIANNIIDQTSGRMFVTDAQYGDLAAYAPGSIIRLSAYNLGKLVNPSLTITDADALTTAVPIQSAAAHSLDVKLPPQIGLGGAYLTLVSGTAKSFATLFVDSQDNIPVVNGCTFSLSPSSTSIGPAAATLSVLVVTQPGCTYSLTSSDPALSGNPTATGTGVLAVNVSENNGPSRTLTFEIAGQPIPITQAAITPVISAISDPWTYTSGFAPGSWVTITGSDLASAPQIWNLDNAVFLPVILGTTTVTFNGVLGSVQYVSPTQINALVPNGNAVQPGSVQVAVVRNGTASTAPPFAMTSAQPSVYSIPNADGSRFFVTAALAGTGTLIGNPAVDSRVLRGARPGDSLDLYMVGLGVTAEPSFFITNRVFSEAAPVKAVVTASLNSSAIPVSFAGLTGPGLYLVRITIPANTPSGTLALQIAADGIATKAPLFLLIE